MATKTTKVTKPADNPSSIGSQRNYELMLVIKPDGTDEKLSATIGAVSQFIAELGGVMADTKMLGKRKLAYPINRCTEGHYVLLQFKSRSTASQELENRLNISEEVIRYLLKNID
ncbi:MAG: 30S ribosomal protein S6 [Dehalococcoidia bacterium]|nr:30S ribosomal protein S6 [Dehalococcoidia bacterium]